MGKCHMVLVVPVDEKQSDTGQTRQLVWDAAIHTLQPGLGKLYEAFYPATKPWGLAIRQPLGIVLGSEVPALFYSAYMAGHQAQQEAIGYHMEELLKTIEPEQVSALGNTLICPVDMAHCSREQAAHTAWYLAFQEGAPLPDCGLYHTGLKSAKITREQEKTVLDYPASHALCVVTVECKENRNGSV